MKYTFNIDDSVNKNKVKQQKKVNFYIRNYEFLQDHKISSMLLFTLLIYLLMISIGDVFPPLVTNSLNTFLKVVLSFCVSGILFSLLELFFSTQRLYKQISDYIGYTVYIRAISVFNDAVNDRMKESEIVPAIKIDYDIIGVSNKKFGLIFKIDDDDYKVVDVIESDKIENKVTNKIYSDRILKSINETDNKCIDDRGVLLANIVLLKNDNIKPGDTINKKDIDNALLLTEVFFVPFVNKKESTT